MPSPLQIYPAQYLCPAHLKCCVTASPKRYGATIKKLNENGFETCTEMLNRYKSKGDERFMKAISCIEGAEMVEDLDCVLGLQDGE